MSEKRVLQREFIVQPFFTSYRGGSVSISGHDTNLPVLESGVRHSLRHCRQSDLYTV